ncbi:MAG TPA: hypothetical protein VMU30_04820 [Bacteroidota bacterium]|nr:hypothetical protein [Bacteroidota bacterium]
MVPLEEIVSSLESVLADQAVFLSKLQRTTPGSLTHDEIHEMEQEITPSGELLSEAMRSIVKLNPHPEIIGNRLKNAFDNMGEILKLLTVLHRNAPL